MEFKFDTFNFITKILKIGITSILSVETTIDPSLASFIGNSATDLLSCLSFEKKKKIKDSIEKLPEQIMPVIADFTMPDECRKNLAYRLFTLDRLKECVESENIVETFKSLIIDICGECQDCDIETLQTDEIADAISNRVMSLFLNDENLRDVVSLFIDRSTYGVVLDNNRKLEDANKKLNVITELLIPSDNTEDRGNNTFVPHKKKTSWITMLPYVPVTEHHIAREDEDEMVQNIFDHTKIAISGIVGGIGKTELLQLVCGRALDMCKYHYVGWIYYSGDFKADILASLASQFIIDNDPIKSLLTLDSQYGQDMIIFVDNADSNNDDEYLDILRRLTCKVIVTTRNQTFFDFKMKNLSLLSKDVATKIYLKYNGQSNGKSDYYIEQIIKLCGYHPMAIELVAKYAKKRKLSSKTVYSELLEHGYNLDGLVDSNWNGNRNELITTQLSKLYNLCNLSLDKQTAYILKCFSILPSKPIVKLFVDSIVDGKNADYVSFDILVDNGWISSVQSGWYMHDVVKSVIKRELAIAIDDCADFLQNLCKYSTNLIDYDVMINSLSLLIGVTEFFSDERDNILLIKIYNDIGYVYQEITDYQNAKKWFEKALWAINCAEQNEEVILLQGLASNNMGMVLQHKITQKIYRNEDISEEEIQSTIAWFDKSIESYEALLQGLAYDRFDIERRKLVAMTNRASCLYQGGYQKEALVSLNKIIYEKLHIVNQVITILFHYYSRLLNDRRYSKTPSIINGYNSLKTLESKIQKFYTSNNEINIRQYINDDISISDVLERLNDYRFVFDNELIPSLVRSCDVYADFQCEYIMTLNNPEEISYRLSMASAIINFALDVCEEVKEVTVFAGNAWGTLSRVHFAWELIFTNVNSKNAAINEQLRGIQILEHVFRESNERQSKDSLFRAYNNMYAYTGEEKWKKKADQLIN